MSNLRIGHGYDVHKYVENRPLILGGVNVPFELGLLGHSDADVLLHAIMDAIFGALALGDIGRHFPDNDESYRGISSITLLEKVKEIMVKNGASVVNIDATVIAQKPKLLTFIPKMCENISVALGVATSQVNVKATTEEGLGFTGKLEGVSAHAVCLLEIK